MKKRRLSTRIVSISLVMVLAVNQEVIMQRDFMPDVVTETISLDKEESTVVVKAASTKKQKIAAYNKKAKKAYKKFLKEYFEKGKTFTYSYKYNCKTYKTKYKWPYKISKRSGEYAIYDINNDGKKELILDITEAEGAGSSWQALFVYYKEKVKCIGISGAYTDFYGYKKGNLIGECYLAGLGYMTAYHKIKNGKLKIAAKSFDTSPFASDGQTSKITYWVGKNKVSKKKFEQYLKKETGSKKSTKKIN